MSDDSPRKGYSGGEVRYPVERPTVSDPRGMSTDLWASTWGSAYVARNQEAWKDRWPFWRDLQQRYPVKSVLEVGCGGGHNLRWMTAEVVAGVDVNEHALIAAQAACRRARLITAPATRLPSADASYELVFTAGVLIHVPPADLPKVMDEIHRVSSQYILSIEYDATHETTVEYRGQLNALWKRPYKHLYEDRFDLEHLESGFLSRPAWDNCTYHLWRKR